MKRKLSKITNAAPSASSGSAAGLSVQDGKRQFPTSEIWNRSSVQRGTNRARVSLARALDDALPLVSYLNRQIPLEAIGRGVVVSSASKDAAFRTAANEYFEKWGTTNAIDVARQFDIYSCQAELGRLIERDGGVFAIKVKSTLPEDLARSLDDKNFRAIQLQFLRRDQIGFDRPPAGEIWEDGIQISGLGAPVSYGVVQRRAAGGSAAPSFRAAADVIHLKRPSLEGVHGVPSCVGGQEAALDGIDLDALSRYSDKIRAAFLGVINTPSGSAPLGMRQNVQPGKKTKTVDGVTTVVDDKSLRYYQIADGVHIPVLRNDEQITFFNGSTLSFGEQCAALAQKVIMAYGVVPEYIQDLTGLGSAACRLVLYKMRAVFASRVAAIEYFLQQVWQLVISDAVQRGVLKFAPDWSVVECKARGNASIDLGRDERAEQNKLLSGTSTVARYANANAEDGEAIRREWIDETAQSIYWGESAPLRNPLHKPVPWFLCINALQLQAVSAFAQATGVSIDQLNAAAAAEIEPPVK